jgi:serine/threonine-protein kinase HipA
MAEQPVDVIVQLAGEDVVAGRLWAHPRERSESATFSYTADYLALGEAYALDPLLPLVSGQQQTPEGRPIFGAFSDCAPDRWGRRLIQRAEKQRARAAGAAERSFAEIDYLLGVRDDLRQGALRFRDPDTGSYLSDASGGVPHLIDLPQLLNAAEHLERDEATEAELQSLLWGGSSLGGARPKAHVIEQDGRIAIAKFPSPSNDEWDVMAWEAVALQLARAAGISVSDWSLHSIDNRSVLIVERFDRAADRRIGYVSAMTMLEVTDGAEASYLDIVDAIETEGDQVNSDLSQLWRRIAFSILISNTDDHLRNHGFLRASTAGWRLSPAFDINPDPRPGTKYLSTAIDSNTTEARVDVLMSVAGLFGLSESGARRILADVVASTTTWRDVAREVRLERTAIEQMASAFEHEQADAARAASRQSSS